MTKVVACRVVDTAPYQSEDRERPQCVALAMFRPTVPARSDAECAEDADPMPARNVLVSLVDRAYGIRTGKTVCVGRALNIAV